MSRINHLDSHVLPITDVTSVASTNVSLESVINNFLVVYPEPTDEQVHSFARLLGLDYADFEAKIYEMLAQIVDQEVEVDDTIDPGNIETEAPEDLFILTYFLFNSKPSDEQIHGLANLIDMPYQELEERVYRMLARYQKEAKLEPNYSSSEESPDWSNSPETQPLVQ
jgi:hypothetical protein